METINEMCELTPPCECGCSPDTDLSQGNIRPNFANPHCEHTGGECGEHILEHPLHLWAIKYGVEGHLKFIGVAVVQAPTRSAAECIFAKNSLFSGTPERLKILAMKEVMPWSEPILFEDCAAIIDRHNLKSYPFLLKSDYEHNIQNISDNVIEAVEDYIEHNPIQQVQSNWNETDETSKAYIQNKPEIPDAQVQSNWNETNESSKAFILNKPTIPEAQVNADWNSESGKSQILNKPTDLVRTSDIEGLLRNDGTVYTGKYLEQVRDLDNFQASEGKIVQYIGETNAKYINSFIYKKVGTQIIIPAGTEYIDINDDSGNLASVGIPNGRYYSIIDETDTVKTKIRIHFASNASVYPIRRTIYAVPITGEYTIDVRVGMLGYASELSRVVSKERYQGGWKITFANGNILYFPPGMQWGDDTFYNSSNIYIFENSDGIRIYTRPYSNNRAVFILEYIEDEDVYQVSAPEELFVYELKTTSSEQTIGTEEWQQWDIQPREDTSHYVTDSEIGWIEH